MKTPGWRGWLESLARTIGGKRDRLPVRRGRRAPSRRLGLECLEDRLAPAITILDSGVGTLDGLLGPTQGAITAAQSAGSQSLSRAALQGVGATTNISIASDAITFNSLSSTLTLQTGAGNSAAFSTTSGAISFTTTTNTLATSGGSLNFSAGTNLTVANLNTNGGDVSLTAGTTGTGSISFVGILTNGSGNLTFRAGPTAGAITQNTGAATGQAASATAVGNITLNSLRGTSVSLTSFSGNVTSVGASPVQASSQLTVSAATGINVSILTPSIRATNSTSGNVLITQLPPPSQDLTVVGSGVNNQAAGGIVSLTNSAGNLALASGATVTTNNGTIFLAGTGLDLAAGTVNSGTAATEVHNSLAGLAFDIGSKVIGKIGITQADLDVITASVLRIGANSVSSINVSAAIHGDASWNNTLALIANGPVTEAAAGSLTLANMRVGAVGPVTLNSVNNVGNLSASITGSGNAFSTNNGTNTLTIPNAGVDGVLGLTTNNANIDLIADNIHIFQVVTPGTGTVILEPFTQTLNITVGTASVPGSTFGITNGSLGWITSGVTQIGVAADTGTIAVTGAINRTPTSTAPSRSQTLDLVTGNTTANAVTQTASLSVANLAVQSVGPVTLTNAGNDVDKLAGAVSGAGSNFNYTDANGFAVGTVAGVVGIHLHGGTGDTPVLTAGGAVTQDSGATIMADRLDLLGTGPFALNDHGNNVSQFVANVTNDVSYTNSGGLLLNGFLGTNGVTSTNGAVSITTVAGSLRVQSNVSAGSTVDLTAGGLDSLLNNGATITGPAGVTLTADRMVLASGGPAPITGMTGAGTSPIVITSPNHGLDTGEEVVISGAEGNTAANGTFTVTVIDGDHFSLNGTTGNGTYPAGAIASAAGNGSGNVLVTVNSTTTGLVNGESVIITGNSYVAGLSSGPTFTIGNVNVNGGAGTTTFTLSGTSSAAAGSATGGSFNGGATWRVTGSVASASSPTGGTTAGVLTVTINSTTTGLGNGDTVNISGNTFAAANGTHVISNVTVGATTTTFQLNGTSATGSGTGGSFVRTAGPGGAVVTNTGGGNVVTLRGFTNGRTVDLGGTGDPSGTLQISQAELNNITTDIVRVGDLGTEGDITVTAALSDATTAWKTLSLLTSIGAGISQHNGATLTVTNLQAAGNTGVSLNQNNVVSTLAGAAASGAFSFVDSANLTVDSVDSGLGFGFGSGIITDGQAVSLTVNVPNDSLTLNQHIDTTHNFGSPAPGGANINLSADNMALNNNSPSSTLNAGTNGTLVLTPFTASNTIAVGGPDAAGQLGIDDNDLSNVSANHVDIGGANQTGAISIDGSITRHPGYNILQLFANGGGGAITQTAGSISVANLTLQANVGIGAAGAIQVVGPINVRFDAAGGNVQISATGALTIAPLFGETSSSAGKTTLTASSPITFAANTTSSGTITVTTTETASENTPAGQLPPPDDDITVNANVTVESTGGDADLTSGDSIVIQAGGTLKSDSGAVNLAAGVGDVDNDAVLTINGAISAGINLTLTSPGDVTLGQMSVSETIGTVFVTSTGGSIRSDGSGTTFIEAHDISLTAAKAIGGDTQISRNDVLMQDATFKQAIDFDVGVGGLLTLSQTGTGGNIQLRNIDGTTNTSLLAGVEPVGAGNQLALIASGGGFAADAGNAAGDLVVDAALTVGANNENLLLAATDGNNVSVSHSLTNTGTGTVTLVVGGTAAGASGGALNVNAAVAAVGGVSLAAAGNAAGDGVFITANVTASGSGSTIAVDANRDVNITGTNTKLSTTSATGGAIRVASAEGLPNFPTGGAGVVTMAATSSIDTSANNSTITVDAGTTAGTGGDITLAVLNANTGAVNVKSFNGSVVDGNGSGANNVTGGAINLSAGGAAGINLDVITSTPATAGVTAMTTSGNITLRSTQQLQVDDISAGATNDVSLAVNNANTAVSSITSLHPNDNVADVMGRTVTLTATGPTTGNTGQIGFFTTGAQFFEVAATTLNASTNNSRLWISAIGGAALGSVNAGTNTAFLRTVNGNLTSTHTGAAVTTPDVTATAVNLSSLAASGSLGTAANPLQVQATNLTATVSGAGNTGSINVRNVAAGGNLNVVGASTVNGAINLTVAGGNLTTTAAAGTDINAPGNTVTLTVSGNLVSGTGAGVTDMGAANLAVSGAGGASGIGTSANPLKTAVGTLAAGVGTGGVFVTNTSAALTLGTVGALNGVTATGGNVSITTSQDLTVSQPVGTATSGANAGVVTLTGGATGAGSNIAINAAINGASATAQGGAGADVFTVTATGATPLSLLGLGGADTFNVTPSALAPISVDGGAGTDALNLDSEHLPVRAVSTFAPNGFTPTGRQEVTYTNLETANVNDAAAVNALYGPNTADRGAALPGLTADERFVQVLYLDALGRVGSKAEIDGWASRFGSGTQAQTQAAIATGIEHSAEGRDRLVKSWYVAYLGRQAQGGEEQPFVNMLLAGQTEEQVLSQILGSTEFFSRAQTLGFGDTTNGNYVRALYQLLLDRTASVAEVAGWEGALSSGTSRQEAALGFLGTQEFRTYDFEAYFNALLHRPSQPSDDLNNLVMSGTDIGTVRIQLEATSEFFTNG